jgi:hypothetical protein
MVLLLVYRFGLRFSEAFEIRRRDVILFDGELTELRIWSDSYRKLKTHGAIRRVARLGELRAVERELVRDWVDHADHLHGEDRLAFLFAPRADSRLLQDKARTASRITDALRAATGNAEARIHHCRHTFTTRLQIALSASGPIATLPSSGPPSGFDSSLEESLRIPPGDRRALWQVAVLVGHSHPDTTLRHYCHGHDLLLAARGLRDPSVEWGHWEWAAVLGVEVRSLRRWMIRQESFPTGIQLALRNRGICRLEDGARPLVVPKQLSPATGTARKQERFPAEELVWIYASLAPDMRLENIARRLGLGPEAVAAAARAIATTCSAICFDEEESKVMDGGLDGELPRLPSPRALSAREIDGLREALHLAGGLPDAVLAAARQTVIESYKPVRDCLVLTSPDQLDHLLPLFATAKMVPCLHLPKPGETDTAFMAEMTAKAAARALATVTDEHLPMAIVGRTRRALLRRAGLFVQEASRGPIRSHKCSAVVLVLASALASLRVAADRRLT